MDGRARGILVESSLLRNILTYQFLNDFSLSVGVEGRLLFRGTRTSVSRPSKTGRQEFGLLQRMEKAGEPRERGGDGRCHCQYRCRRKPRFWKEKRRSVSLPLVEKPQESSTSAAKTAKILDGKKASVHKTYKTQTEANDKVRALNRDSERTFETLALLYGRLEQVNSDLADVDTKSDKSFESEWRTPRKNIKQAQTFVEIASQTFNDSHAEYHRLTAWFDEAEGATNEGLGCTHKSIAKTAAATSAMSVGVGEHGRERNEVPAGCPDPGEQHAHRRNPGRGCGNGAITGRRRW